MNHQIKATTRAALIAELLSLAQAGKWDELHTRITELITVDGSSPDTEWLLSFLTAIIAQKYDDALVIIEEQAKLDAETVDPAAPVLVTVAAHTRRAPGAVAASPGKSFSLDEWRNKVRSAWDALNSGWPYDSPSNSYAWVDEVFDDQIIVSRQDEYWQIPYTLVNDEVIFAPIDQWTEVVRLQQWQPKGEVAAAPAAPAGVVKSLDDAGRIGAYAIRFGSAEEPDLSEHSDFFTKDTNYWLDELGWSAGKAIAPMLYEHAREETTGSDPVVGRWTKAVIDDVGVWVEGQLDRAKKYTAWVERLVKKGVLKLSSDSAPHLVQREAQNNGTHKVLRWPLLAASMTTTPAEPRLLPVEALGAAYKSVGVTDFNQLITDLEVKTMDQVTIDQIASAVAAKMSPPPAAVNDEGRRMNDEGAAKAAATPGLEEIVSAVTDGVINKLAEMPAIKEAGFLKPISRGPFINKTPHNMDEYKAFGLYLHYGEHRLQDSVKALLKFDSGRGREVDDGVKVALNVGTTTQGGFLVPVDYSMELVRSLAELSHLRSARARQIKFPDALTFKVEGLTFSATAVLTSEAAAYDQVEPTIGETTFQAYKYTRLAKASDELIDDSRFDLWKEILQPDWAQAFAAAENTAFTTGTGSSQPQGVVTGAGTGKTTASATVITADEIKDQYYSLNHRYRESPACAFMMNDAIVQYIDKLKDGQGRYLIGGDLTKGMPLTLLGRPIIINNTMASSVATGNKTILFGDFSYYWIADRSSKGPDGKLAQTEIYVRRLNELYAATGQVGFRAYMRVDAHVMLAAAFKLLVQA